MIYNIIRYSTISWHVYFPRFTIAPNFLNGNQALFVMDTADNIEILIVLST